MMLASAISVYLTGCNGNIMETVGLSSGSADEVTAAAPLGDQNGQGGNSGDNGSGGNTSGGGNTGGGNTGGGNTGGGNTGGGNTGGGNGGGGGIVGEAGQGYRIQHDVYVSNEQYNWITSADAYYKKPDGNTYKIEILQVSQGGNPVQTLSNRIPIEGYDYFNFCQETSSVGLAKDGSEIACECVVISVESADPDVDVILDPNDDGGFGIGLTAQAETSGQNGNGICAPNAGNPAGPDVVDPVNDPPPPPPTVASLLPPPAGQIHITVACNGADVDDPSTHKTRNILVNKHWHTD